MLIVGIGYKKYSGKDTLASYILQSLPSNAAMSCALTHFAFPLKMEVAHACNIPIEEIEKNKDIFRPLLQWWGDFRCIYGGQPNYWIDKLDDHIEVCQKRGTKLVLIPDVRKKNECEYIKLKQGKLIHITRPELQSIDTHRTEIELDDYNEWDMTVVNSGSKEELLHKAKGIVNSLIVPNL